MPVNKKLLEITNEFGGTAKLARHLGICPATLTAWIRGRWMPLGAKGTDTKGRRRFNPRTQEAVRRLCELVCDTPESIFPGYIRDSRKVCDDDGLEFRSLKSCDLQIADKSAFVDMDSHIDAKEACGKLLGLLMPRERDIVVSWFGVGTQPENLLEIAKRYRVTRETARQIYMRAVLKMQSYAIAHGIDY